MKLLMWFVMLTKRLYKKPAFAAILLLIPALVLLYAGSAGEDSGMLTVALSQEGSDSLAAAVIRDLEDSSQLIRYVVCESAEDAENLVRYGKADMAWIFASHMEDRLAAFLAQPSAKNALARVVVRQDDVSLMLARERLSGGLYQVLSQRLYVTYVRENVPGLSHLSDGELMDYYHSRQITDELFVFGEESPALAEGVTTHYLTAPVRGLLAVVMVLCAMASAMYHMADCRRGTFGWVSAQRRWAVELGCQLVSLLQVGAAVLLALGLAGMAGHPGQELAATALYCLCCAGFAMALGRLCGSAGVLGTAMPLALVAMLVVCPVFFDLGALRPFQYLLPPTYYINALYNAKYFGYMVLYTGGCFGVYALLGLGKNRRNHGSF